eukprot:CAMPEP_0197185454 /NCGR_PEP_ID=MMETSP1423-20130617/11972_1 /TAXON_ID=476441 /ORGANISM="Pseudo-nitzschia heimii, Strain UNC1101" /LENGTH=352 /DNA_ID=CAMNT_0042636521 /DNA_START=325 /DNA_END=1383 /DNA_ORIENTATION=+
MSLTSCFYVSVRPIPEEGMPEMPKEGFGWISRQVEVMEPPAYGKQCAWYTAEERALYFDSMWNAGFAMSIITVLLGVVVMSIVLCTCCVAFQLPTFDGLFWTCMICFVAQALTFLSWGSELCEEMECTWSSGTGMNLTAAMMWVWAANMIKSFPEALPPRTRNGEENHGDRKYDDDDDGAGDVYLSNRSMNPDETTARGGDDIYRDGSDGIYRDDEYGDWDNDNAGDNGDGYYDDDGNWVPNNSSRDYDSYDDYDDEDNTREGKKKRGGNNAGGYSDYDNESSSNWAEEEEDGDDFDETAPLDAPSTASNHDAKRKKKKKKKKKDANELSSHSLGSYANDDWDNETGSFRYT